MDWGLVLAALGVGVVVGLTGMGGGALMTPILVLFFGVPPLAAVSNDLAASAVMKPVGSWVHLRHGTVRRDLVGWLCLGSVPAAFAGVLVARALGHGSGVDGVVRTALGLALLAAALGMAVRALLARRDPSPTRARVRPLPTALIGAAGGLLVGMTSVGSGSLMIVALMFLYPGLRARELVGTDLLQAVPLVLAAALGHVLFGEFHPGLTLALLAGSIPGTWLGAQVSARVSGAVLRPVLAVVLLASALKLFGVGTIATAAVLAGAVLAASAGVLLRRRRAVRLGAEPA